MKLFFKCLPIRLNRWWNYTVKHLFVWHQMRSGHLLLVVAFLVTRSSWCGWDPSPVMTCVCLSCKLLTTPLTSRWCCWGWWCWWWWWWSSNDSHCWRHLWPHQQIAWSRPCRQLPCKTSVNSAEFNQTDLAVASVIPNWQNWYGELYAK